MPRAATHPYAVFTAKNIVTGADEIAACEPYAIEVAVLRCLVEAGEFALFDLRINNWRGIVLGIRYTYIYGADRFHDCLIHVDRSDTVVCPV